MIVTKIFVKNRKVTVMHVKEMFAIYKYPHSSLRLTQAPELRKVEIVDVEGTRHYYEPKQFSKAN